MSESSLTRNDEGVNESTNPAHTNTPNRWNPTAWIIGDPTIGEATWIGAFTVIDGSGGLTIGSGCDISSGAQIYTHSTVRRCVSNRARDIERAPTSIGDRVHIGAGAIVLMGCEIGDGAVVGAGAIVREGSVVPSGALAVGVPARIILDGATKILSGNNTQ